MEKCRLDSSEIVRRTSLLPKSGLWDLRLRRGSPYLLGFQEGGGSLEHPDTKE